jgi:hypothetical protein
MATLGINWAGVVLTLTESDAKSLEAADDIGAAGAALVAATAVPAGVPPIGILSAIVGAYLRLNKTLLTTIDKGNGVYLTLPWLAIYLGQWWLIIPTPVPVQAGGKGTVTVRRDTGSDFGPNEDWTHGPYFGTLGIFFADVTGDGKADAIVVNDS